jgi:hypothetical protein
VIRERVLDGPHQPTAVLRQLGFLTEFVALAARSDGLRAAILVGSMAGGTADEMSDVDLVLVTSPPAAFRGREAWRSLIPGRVLYASESSGSAGSRIQLVTGDLVCVDLTLSARRWLPCLLPPFRVLFDKDGAVAEIGTAELGSRVVGTSDGVPDLPLALLAIARHHMRGETERALSELDEVIRQLPRQGAKMGNEKQQARA